MAKNLPAMQETWVWSLGLEDLMEKGMTTHSNILAWRIPWTEKRRLSPQGHMKLFTCAYSVSICASSLQSVSLKNLNIHLLDSLSYR